MSFADEVGVEQLVGLPDFFWDVFHCHLEGFLSSLDFLLKPFLLLKVLGHVEFLVERPDLLFDVGGSHENLLHGILEVLLLDKVYHCNDVINVVLIGSRTERDHLIISPIRELRLDLGLFLFLIRIHRGHVWDWGPSGNDSPLAFQVLEPFR